MADPVLPRSRGTYAAHVPNLRQDKPWKGESDVRQHGNLSQQSRGFDSLPEGASQPAGSQSCMGSGNSVREA